MNKVLLIAFLITFGMSDSNQSNYFMVKMNLGNQLSKLKQYLPIPRSEYSTLLRKHEALSKRYEGLETSLGEMGRKVSDLEVKLTELSKPKVDPQPTDVHSAATRQATPPAEQYSIDGLFELKSNSYKLEEGDIRKVSEYLTELKNRGIIENWQIGKPTTLRGREGEAKKFGFFPLDHRYTADSHYTAVSLDMPDNKDYKLLILLNQYGRVPSSVLGTFYSVPAGVRDSGRLVSPTQIKIVDKSDEVLIFEITSKGTIG